MNEVRPPPLPAASCTGSFFGRAAPVLKLAVIGTLALVLLIPLAMIQGVLSERRARKAEAIEEITRSWGARQTVIGPVWIVPYTYDVVEFINQRVDNRTERVESRRTESARLYILPAAFACTGTLDPKTLHRGIYEAVVYAGALDLSGRFERPDLKSLRIPEDRLKWEESEVTLAVTDLRGTRESLVLEAGGERIPLVSGSLLPGFDSGVRARPGAVAAANTAWTFRVAMTLNGSRSLEIVPSGASTTVRLSSTWPDPSFMGAFLPVDRTVGAEGFTADWQVAQYGRTFPAVWTDAKGSPAPDSGAFARSSFGVSLLSLVDTYRTVERSIKYGILFIALVFTAFFLFEILSALRIHPLQYILVGAALCLFYLGLLSLSEFVAFPAAYAAAAGASLLLVTAYCARVLHGGRRTRIVAGVLVLTYGCLYVLLQLQDFSLLFGTIGLFAALGAVMYATRNVDWYATGRR